MKPLRRGPSLRRQHFVLIGNALRGLPMTATPDEVDARLREADPDYAGSYSTWRRSVRAVQAERAKWVEWQGQDASAVRPRERTRAHGATR